MNSIVRPMNSAICPLAQCSHVMLLFTNSVFVPCTVLTCDITVHPLEEKKMQTRVWKRRSKSTPSQSRGLTKSKILWVIKLGNKYQTCHLRKLEYFKWWVKRNEWRKLKNEWEVIKNKKSQTAPLSFNYILLTFYAVKKKQKILWNK